jgi:hypothetical protein
MTARWVHSGFRICGLTGLALAICTALVLASHSHLPLRIILLMALVGSLASYAVLIATIVVIGAERWVFYHHAFAAACAALLCLLALHQPLLPYLDVAGISLMVLLACGRFGCFLVGCCHGRPADFGVSYGPEHVVAGFPRDLAGVRLLPVQPAEGLWVALVAAVGSRMIWTGAAPGVPFSWCLIAYGGGRFLLELWRGDRDRRLHWGLCEAQWTSLMLVVLVTVLQMAGSLPRTAWQLALALVWAIVVAAIWVRRSRRPLFQRLQRPDHVRELTLALDRITASNRISVETTSMGLRISGCAFTGSEEQRCVYTVSAGDGELDTGTALMLARLMRRLRHPQDEIDVVAGHTGIFHLVVRAPLAGCTTTR